MYHTLKQFSKKIIPAKFIKRYEKLFRKAISFYYAGNKYHCNICGFNLSGFIELRNDNKLCPKCGSLSRTRRLWNILENMIQDKTVLHFSPSKSLKDKINKSSVKNYFTTDYKNEFDANKQLNILAINEPDNHYDLIICYHILEHIEDDLKAMHELIRVLKPTGICIIPPLKEGNIYENSSVKTPAERRKHFGQEDHVRIYSLEGLKTRLKKVGFEPKERIYLEEFNNKTGYIPKDIVVFANKPEN